MTETNSESDWHNKIDGEFKDWYPEMLQDLSDHLKSNSSHEEQLSEFARRNVSLAGQLMLKEIYISELVTKLEIAKDALQDVWNQCSHEHWQSVGEALNVLNNAIKMHQEYESK